MTVSAHCLACEWLCLHVNQSTTTEKKQNSTRFSPQRLCCFLIDKRPVCGTSDSSLSSGHFSNRSPTSPTFCLLPACPLFTCDATNLNASHVGESREGRGHRAEWLNDCCKHFSVYSLDNENIDKSYGLFHLLSITTLKHKLG